MVISLVPSRQPPWRIAGISVCRFIPSAFIYVRSCLSVLSYLKQLETIAAFRSPEFELCPTLDTSSDHLEESDRALEMAANYWESTQRRHWQFTREKLEVLRKKLEDEDQNLVQMYPLPALRHLSIYFNQRKPPHDRCTPF